MAVSIHHMLLFIQSANLLFVHQLSVSIHHMLLFINVCECMAGITIKFQYITCYSLSECVRFGHPPNMVSIHHMLLFIKCFPLFAVGNKKFQYITCYSLSEKLGEIVNRRSSFNTSHVTLYRSSSIKSKPDLQVSIHHMLLFILGGEVLVFPALASFNTSHVTLYRIHAVFRFSWQKRFNTSHVTLYQ